MDHRAIDREFAEDVRRGLSAPEKFLMSRYFYDAAGDRHFQDIMSSPEYYLSNCEMEILRAQGADIAAILAEGGPFELVELGSGDGSKIRHLLDALHALEVDFVFRPVDISANSLALLEERLRPGRDWLNMRPLNVNYMDWLDGLEPGEPRRVFAFMGSNLGNFERSSAIGFLSIIHAAMAQDDALLIGLDLKKDPEIVKAAYNDAGGHTREFNLNLLRRINRELGGDFNLAAFSHQPQYDPESGAATSWLRSEQAQRVWIEALQQRFEFAAGERVFMEVSQKYDQDMINSLASAAGFRVARSFTDEKGWFTDQVWRPASD